jgi:NADPH2:quinone reductase
VKALLSRDPGGPETLALEEAPDPVATPGMVVVEVKAVGVNFPDVLMIEDKYQIKPERPFSPGGELAGVVRSVGDGVAHLMPGDRVLATCGTGGMAELAAVQAFKTFKIPDSMPFDEAAGFLLTYTTSYYALVHRGRIRPGETLLVLGAAGGVGLAAVEIGKALGARVVAAASSEAKAALAKARGAEAAIVYPLGPFDRDGQKALAELIKGAVGPDGADVVYDAVGGDYAEAALRATAWEGRFLVVGFPAGIPRIPLNLPLLKGCDIVGVFWGASVARDPERHQADVAALMALYEAGKVRPHVSERYPLARGGEAIARLGAREALGKVVVVVD